MKHPLKTSSYANLLKSIQNADNHASKVIKKYKRIITESKRKNDIESAYLAYEVITMILAGATIKQFEAVNNRLIKSLARCAKFGGYTLEEYEGVKYVLSKDDEYWILHNKLNGEKFFSRFYEE